MGCKLNQIEGYISGYDVTGQSLGSNTLEFKLLDPYNSMRNARNAKEILMKAAADYLAAIPSTTEIYDDDPQCHKCKKSNENVTFYYGSLTLRVTTSDAGSAGAATTATVPLPLNCDQAVSFS